MNKFLGTLGLLTILFLLYANINDKIEQDKADKVKKAEIVRIEKAEKVHGTPEHIAKMEKIKGTSEYNDKIKAEKVENERKIKQDRIDRIALLKSEPIEGQDCSTVMDKMEYQGWGLSSYFNSKTYDNKDYSSLTYRKGSTIKNLVFRDHILDSVSTYSY